jgi:hypothetical protein
MGIEKIAEDKRKLKLPKEYRDCLIGKKSFAARIKSHGLLPAALSTVNK